MESDAPLNNYELVKDWIGLIQVFTCPEDAETRSTLIDHMSQILFELHDFLIKNVGITEEISLKELSNDFNDTIINKFPEKKLADVLTGIFEHIAPHAVNVASPYFVGHMTAAIPYFMVHLKAIVAALNQNVVKLETSKVVSILEKQVIAKIHRLIFNCDESFYQDHVQNTDTSLGSFMEGGTTANLTALWVARNTALGPKAGFGGIEKEGLYAAYKAYDIDRCVILVSRRAHYSFRKAGGILGIGNENIVDVDVDHNNKVNIEALEDTITRIKKDQRTKIIAIVGIAGTTETGSVDPLHRIADICEREHIHFHTDAAWGGPTLMSEKYKYLLDGIQRADSVTIDGHKQFYMPMGCGMIYFRNPKSLDAIAYHANYVNRRGSVDLGIKTLSGSREANSLILDSALKIMGTRGYGMLIEHGIELAAEFAKEIKKRDNFQLVTEPELNILTYRLCPSTFREELKYATPERIIAINDELNELNRNLQQEQREAGNSFVSRTVLEQENIFPGFPPGKIVVLRSVLMNPLTNIEILKDILDEQEDLYENWCLGKNSSDKTRKYTERSAML
jgi:glutamate decarboxylase